MKKAVMAFCALDQFSKKLSHHGNVVKAWRNRKLQGTKFSVSVSLRKKDEQERRKLLWSDHPSGSSEKLKHCLSGKIPCFPYSLLLSTCILTILSSSVQRLFRILCNKDIGIFLLKICLLDSPISLTAYRFTSKNMKSLTLVVYVPNENITRNKALQKTGLLLLIKILLNTRRYKINGQFKKYLVRANYWNSLYIPLKIHLLTQKWLSQR